MNEKFKVGLGQLLINAKIPAAIMITFGDHLQVMLATMIPKNHPDHAMLKELEYDIADFLSKKMDITFNQIEESSERTFIKKTT